MTSNLKRQLNSPDNTFKQQAEEFIKNNSDIPFRGKAKFTGNFGYTERYKYITQKAKRPGDKTKTAMVWGYPGIHWGVDRGYSGEVIAPFDFGKSKSKDWKNKWWGFDIYLFHSIGFRFRVCHMYPNEIQIMDILKKKGAVNKGTFFGKPGSYGASTGRHTHTEIEAWDYSGPWIDTNKILDWILYIQYGEESLKGFTDTQVVEIARDECKKVNDENWTNESIINDFLYLCKIKKIVFINSHKIIKHCGGKKYTTLYNSKSLFNI